MKVKSMIRTLAMTAAFLFSSTANAGKPLDVDCDLFKATNAAVNDFLDGEAIQYNNLGDLASSAILDESVFDQLSALILLFSGGEIEFTSASQMISTTGRCGLMPQLLAEIGN
jgi:hypothetical protein